jgi:hypothetical protein
MDEVRKTKWGNEIPSLEEAWDFVLRNFATVDVIPTHGLLRVSLRVGGYNYIERDSLEECVADSKEYRRVNRP